MVSINYCNLIKNVTGIFEKNPILYLGATVKTPVFGARKLMFTKHQPTMEKLLNKATCTHVHHLFIFRGAENMRDKIS
jgi:hypothetical protein